MTTLSGHRSKGSPTAAARTAQAVKGGAGVATLAGQTSATMARQDNKLSNCYRMALDRLKEILSKPASDNAGVALQISAAKAIFGRLDSRAKQMLAAAALPAGDVLAGLSLDALRAIEAKREAELKVIDNAPPG